ncbi:MAG TPA: adenylate/guanylate cyclase domain-containing protein [Casimicrobiaceae bacterium]|jgi:class 3 adenylate cyclase
MPIATSELAVLFADVSGSTRLYESLGDERALATVGQCLAFVREACDGHAGRVIKTIGDEIMAVFPLADQAAEAATAMQARISTAPFVDGQRIAIRVGFHFGPAIETGADVFGDSVNIAARLANVAHASQVITSAATASMLSPWLRARTRELAALTVKGKQQDMTVFELLWQDSNDDLTTLSTRVSVTPARLRVHHGDREIVLDAWQATLSLGRDAQNDVVIDDRKASRMHAHIERRRDRFVLIDHSSNGTFLTVEGEPEIPLRREEFVLRGSGRISFGHAHAIDPRETVDFACGG